MGLFGGKDWNVLAIIFERKDIYRVNGNRARGGLAPKVRDGAKTHERTIFWAVFDQKGTFLEGGPGRASKLVAHDVADRLQRELQRIPDVRDILAALESGKHDRIARTLHWEGYPTDQPGK